MVIIAHRGKGFRLPENSIEAFSVCVSAGLGVETDFRDYLGTLVVSHDIADSESPTAGSAFKEFAKAPDAWFALNIKADGCAKLIQDYIEKHKIQNYFCFDMSIPQTLEYIKTDLVFFTRQSEYEPIPALYEQASGVWLDSFLRDEWVTEEITRHKQNGKQICVVSPELHGRQHIGLWERLLEADSDCMLCTDYPVEAARFFKSSERRRTE